MIKKVKLGDLVEFQRGYDLPKNNAKGGKYPVVTSNGIMTYHDEYKSGKSIVVGRSGTVGNPQLIESDFWPHNTTLYVKDFKNNCVEYMYYLLLNMDIGKMKSGSNIPTLNRNHLHPLKILAETDNEKQKEIARVLKVIDDKIENNNNINAELESMAKTIYDYWFLQFEFPNEDGKPYKFSGGKMVWNEELKREIPEGWKIKMLKEIESNIVTGKTPSTKEKGNYNGDIPFITIGDIRGNMYVTKTEQTLSKKGAEGQNNKYIPPNSICVTCIASPGLVGFSTRISQTNQQINTVVCDNDINRLYLYFSIRYHFKFSSGAKTGNTFANMNKEDFSTIKLLYPEKEILKKYDDKIKEIAKMILAKSNENQELISLRDFLLPLLMNGQVGFKD